MRRALVAWLALSAPAAAQPNLVAPHAVYTYEQRLGVEVPGDLTFADEDGKPVRLGDLMTGRPVVLVLVQYRCPKLCNVVLSGLVEALRDLPLVPGKDYEVVTVSFDPREKPALAKANKVSHVEEYARGRPGPLRAAEKGWHWLTGEQSAIDVLTAVVGFQYAYSPKEDRYAHGSGLVVLTPADGDRPARVSAYLYGIKFDHLGGAINKARGGGIGRPLKAYERVLLLCYDFDSATGKWSANIMKIVRTLGVLTVLVLAGWLMMAWRKGPRPAPASGKPEG
jgi:protein SCO1/2